MGEPRLTIFLGAGGVGKTTLSAAYATARAMAGARVALLSIDPAKRMQSALGLDKLDDEGVEVPLPADGRGRLFAFQLLVPSLLKRWIHEQGMPSEREEKLMRHGFFSVVSERLGSATDAFAAARLAEIRESLPELDEVVVDTAPGIHAIDFIVKPERLMEFMDGKLVELIRMLASPEPVGFLSGVMRIGAKRLLSGLSAIGGEGFLYAMGEFLLLLEGVFVRLGERLFVAHRWLRAGSTSIHVVASLREDAISVAELFRDTLVRLGIEPRSIFLNRLIPTELQSDAGFVTFLREAEERSGCEGVVEVAADCDLAEQEATRMFAGYILELSEQQVRAKERLGPLFSLVGEVPMIAALDSNKRVRISDLAKLGAIVVSQIPTRER